MAEHLAPVDDQVKVPSAVTRAAEAAEAYYKTEPAPEAPTKTEAAEPVQENLASEQPQEPAPEPEPVPQEVQPSPEPNWEHRYKSMEGRVRQLTDINNTLTQNMQQLSTSISEMRQPSQPQQRLVTDEERKAYGDDLLSVVQRQALEAVSPELRRLQAENQNLQQRVARDEARDVYSALDAQLPNWRDINTHPEFLQWLALPDIYSGQVRAGMLRAAFASGDAGRVLAFFRGFVSEQGSFDDSAPQPASAAEAPRRQAAVQLRDLAAPGKARPAPGNVPLRAEPIVITNKDIDRFYERVRQGHYAGRVEQKDAEEAKIYAAVREGRVRRVK